MLSAIWWSYGDNVVNLQVWAKVNLFAIVYLHKYESMTICPPWRTLVGDFPERQNVGDVASVAPLMDPHHQYPHENCLINLKDRVQKACRKENRSHGPSSQATIWNNCLRKFRGISHISRSLQLHRNTAAKKGKKWEKEKLGAYACSSHLSCRQSWFHSLDKKRGKNYIFGKSMKKYKLFLVTGREINWSIFTQSRILQLLCNNLACFYSFQINMLAS